MGIVEAPIFEGLDTSRCRIVFLQAAGNLYGAVHGIVVVNESAQESDDDSRR